jgi:hypothetical protein
MTFAMIANRTSVTTINSIDLMRKFVILISGEAPSLSARPRIYGLHILFSSKNAPRL